MLIRNVKCLQLAGHLKILISLKAVVRRRSAKKLFLEILQNLQENTCARVSFLIKLQVSGTGEKESH